MSKKERNKQRKGEKKKALREKGNLKDVFKKGKERGKMTQK
jgi:hypothetical protein